MLPGLDLGAPLGELLRPLGAPASGNPPDDQREHEDRADEHPSHHITPPRLVKRSTAGAAGSRSHHAVAGRLTRWCNQRDGEERAGEDTSQRRTTKPRCGTVSIAA
jgi:hypothetical protein